MKTIELLNRLFEDYDCKLAISKYMNENIETEEYDKFVKFPNSDVDEFLSLDEISQYGTCDVLEEFINDLEWCYVSLNQNLTFDFVKKYQDRIVWSNFSEICSSEILDNFNDKIYMYEVTRNPNLTIEFVKKNENKISWDGISEHASLEILECFKDKLYHSGLTMNKNATRAFWISLDEKYRYSN